MAFDRTSGQAVPAEPLVVPKDTKWNKPELWIDAGVVAKRAAGVKGQTAVVTAVTDGDTAKLSTPGGALNCRIDMIEAPETKKDWKQPPEPGQPMADESKKSLQDLIEGKEVTVYVTKAASKDNYGRSLCQVEIKGVNVSMEQVRRGMAYVYEHFVDKAADPEVYDAQAKAKQDNLGVHSIKGGESPAQYRRRFKKDR